MPNYNKSQRFYIPFIPSAQVNYFILFQLYEIAKYNPINKCHDTVIYKSVAELAKVLNISSSTLNRILTNAEYKEFITVDKSKRTIIINNDIRKSGKPFVILNITEIQILRSIGENLLCKYLICLKYYCGSSKTKTVDMTAKQFLEKMGYSTNTNYPDRLAHYNTILKGYKLLNIKSYIDGAGHKRNIYTYLYSFG